MNSMNTPPPGWYPDPSNASMQRYWDGLNWTSETRMPEPYRPPGAPSGGLGGYGPPNTGGGMGQSYGNLGPQEPNYGGPSYGSQSPNGMTRPDNYLTWALVATILCCWPLGIVSIVYSTKVNKFWENGQYTEAVKASSKAKTWAIITAVSGAGFLVLWLVAALLTGSVS